MREKKQHTHTQKSIPGPSEVNISCQKQHVFVEILLTQPDNNAFKVISVPSLFAVPLSSSATNTASADADDRQEIVSAHVLWNPTVVATSGMAHQDLNGGSAGPAVVKAEPARSVLVVVSAGVFTARGLLHVAREDVKAKVAPLGAAGADPGQRCSARQRLGPLGSLGHGHRAGHSALALPHGPPAFIEFLTLMGSSLLLVRIGQCCAVFDKQSSFFISAVSLIFVGPLWVAAVGGR